MVDHENRKTHVSKSEKEVIVLGTENGATKPDIISTLMPLGIDLYIIAP